MQLDELTAYAKEKYQIDEQHKWADFPGFSVLSHPQTGKWVALLMRQWDTETGREIERCDLKCGEGILQRLPRPFLSPAVRMRGNSWVNVAFDERTDRETVFQLFDRAIEAGRAQGYTLVLGSSPPIDGGAYRETALPFDGSRYQAEKIPDRLRQMRRQFEYGRESAESRAKIFYQQAVLMWDYEDDQPWEGNFASFFPTYHDLSTRQLRGYFTWRAQLRRGNVQPIPTSAAYLYVYELLNGVGAASPEESLDKLRDFERVWLDSGIGDVKMRSNLRRWMLDFAVLHDLPNELARQCADPELIAQDEALAVLREPEKRTDEELFSALCCLGGKKTLNSPVLSKDPERGKRLFADSWRRASQYQWQEQGLFSLCFGSLITRRWVPLSNAVYYEREKPSYRNYILDACRSYHCRYGVWQTVAYDRLNYDRARLQGFLHQTDARLRRYLKTGRYLRENLADSWADPYIDAAIEADRCAERKAARPPLIIDLSGLEQIRRDAAETRESLLTEDEIEEHVEPETIIVEEPEQAEADESPFELPLDSVQIRVLRALLAGKNTDAILREAHRMPSLTADAINESLFDIFGDTVLLCEEDRLFLVDDYSEELEHYLGGA